MATSASLESPLSSLRPDSQADAWSEGERLAAAQRLYAPIQKWQTRVLRLHAGSGDEPLVADLLVADLVTLEGLALHNEHELVSYEAISYAWGPPTLICGIVCNGMLWYITPTLQRALKRFRRTDTHRYLWADALCISQSDAEEKSFQVQNLFTIFGKAERVLVWLGEQGGVDGVAVDYLRARMAVPEAEGYPEDTTTLMGIADQLQDLCTRPWVRRLWVQQEVFVAREVKVFCGAHCFPFDCLKEAAWLLDVARKTGAARDLSQFTSSILRMRIAGRDRVLWLERRRELERSRRMWAPNTIELDYGIPPESFNFRLCPCEEYSSGARPTGFLGDEEEAAPTNVECVMSMFSGLEASDPHDFVYALLGMSSARLSTGPSMPDPSDERLLLRLDYLRPMSLVYQDVTKYVMSRDRSLDILVSHYPLLREHGEKDDNPLPSWVPDWRNARFHSTSRKHLGFWPLDWQKDDDVGVLRLRGKAFARIQAIESKTNEDANIPNFSHGRRVLTAFRLRPYLQEQQVSQHKFPRRNLMLHCRAGRPWCTYGQAREGDVLTCVKGTILPIIMRGLGQGAFIFVGAAAPDVDLGSRLPWDLPSFYPGAYYTFMEDRDD